MSLTPKRPQIASSDKLVLESFNDAKIFLIDDEEIVVKLFTLYLQRNGFTNVFGFTDSTEALDTLRFVTPDIILTDIHMPEVSGSFLTKLIRSFEHLSNVPIVAVTADIREETRDSILRKGANDIMYKPVEESEMMQRIARLLNESSQRKKKFFAAQSAHKLKMKQRKAAQSVRENELRNILR